MDFVDFVTWLPWLSLSVSLLLLHLALAWSLRLRFGVGVGINFGFGIPLVRCGTTLSLTLVDLLRRTFRVLGVLPRPRLRRLVMESRNIYFFRTIDLLFVVGEPYLLDGWSRGRRSTPYSLSLPRWLVVRIKLAWSRILVVR